MTTLTHSETINELAAALSQAQGEIEGARKGGVNPHFRSKYADLASVWDAVRAPLSKHGLSIVQVPCAEGATVSIETLLMHTSGQWIKGLLTVTAKDDGPQAIGSCLTYLRRYTLQSFAGVAPEDDDAEKAEGRNGRTAQAQAQPVQEPRGYEDFVIQFSTVANQGLEPLRAAFKEAKPEYRDYLVKHDNVNYEAIKLRAAKVKPKPEAVAS